jgi:haloalkane dehalogenase
MGTDEPAGDERAGTTEATAAGVEDGPAPVDAAHDDHSWLDREAYPFETACVGLDAGAVHYVDDGPADGGRGTLLLLHGNPTWSFMWRYVVGALRDEWRCVAPDLLGFGLSEKPADFSYRPADHAAVVESLVESLGLRDVVLLVHDWGGPIGLSYATRHPENVRGLVVTNTTMWPTESDAAAAAFSWLLGGPIGRAAARRYDVFGRLAMPLAFRDRSALTPAVHRHYLAPHARPEDRVGTWVFPREVTGSNDWLRELWGRRDAIRDHPTRLLWSVDDPFFRPRYLRTFEALFRSASVVRLRGVGHYAAEELGPDYPPYVRAWLDRTFDDGT